MINPFTICIIIYFNGKLYTVNTSTRNKLCISSSGATPYNIENNNSFYKYSTSFNEEYILDTTSTLDNVKNFVL